MALFFQWLERWQNRTLGDHLIAAGLGFLGMAMYMAVLAPKKLILPRYDEKGRYVELNLIGYFIVGMGAAVIVDWVEPIEIVAGLLAMPTVELVITKAPSLLVKAILSWLPNREGK